jgi:hypothetical protein
VSATVSVCVFLVFWGFFFKGFFGLGFVVLVFLVSGVSLTLRFGYLEFREEKN